MTRKQEADYEGMYRVGRRPSRLKSHNAVSWQKIEQTIVSNGGTASLSALSIAVKDHQHGSKNARHPFQFVTYCIRMEWLEPV